MTAEDTASQVSEREEDTQVSKMEARLVGERVRLNAQVVSEQGQKALPAKLNVNCSRCDGDVEVELTKFENRGLLEAVVFRQRELQRRANSALVADKGEQCIKAVGHRVSVEESGFMDYAILGVRDLLEEVERFDQQVYRSRRVHLISVKVPPSKKVRIKGFVTVDPTNRDICVLADQIEPLETQVAGFSVKEEDRLEWPKWFNGDLGIASQIAPDMVGREDVQRIFLLNLHSVPEIPDIYDRVIRGCIRVLLFGDTKTNKTEGAKDLTNHYSLGGYIVAESSSRAGVTYTIDTEDRAIIWGELPNNDLGLVVIDGLHIMFGEEMRELREGLENQRIIVRRSVSGEALARTRVIGILNPNKPMNQYPYPCMAVKDNPAFYEAPDITRWDIFVPFAKEDVPEETVAGRKPKLRPIPEDVFKRHVYWAWSRKSEHIKYTDEAKESIVKASIELMKGYALSNLPIVHLGVRDTLCRLSVAQACLNHSTDEANIIIIVDKVHVEKALETYEEMLDRLRLKEYKLEEEGSLEIKPTEFEAIVKDLGETELAILKAVKIHSKSSPVLAGELDLSDVTIKRHYRLLRKHVLIESSPRIGISLTARGVQLLKTLASGFSISVSKNDTISRERGEMVSKNDTEILKPSIAPLDISTGEKPTLGDVLALLRKDWKRGLYTDFDSILVEKYGYRKEEAERLRKRWENDGLLGYDPDGYLTWV